MCIRDRPATARPGWFSGRAVAGGGILHCAVRQSGQGGQHVDRARHAERRRRDDRHRHERDSFRSGAGAGSFGTGGRESCIIGDAMFKIALVGLMMIWMAVVATPVAKAQSGGPVYELRIYTAVE